MSEILSEQYIQQLRNVFDIFDEKQEGLITVEHFENIGKNQFGHEDINGILTRLDPDATGKISFDSFCRGILSILNVEESSNTTYSEVKNGHLLSKEPVDEDRISCGTQETPSEFSNSTFNEYDMTDEDTSRYSTLERQNGHNAFQDFDDKFIKKDDETDSAIVGSVTMGSPNNHPEYYERSDLGICDSDEKYEDYGENEQSNNFEYNNMDDFNDSIPTRRGFSSFESCHKSLHLPRRDSWLHSSFRRSPGSNRRLPSSSALASQLFKAGSTSCSRHNSFESEDMHSEMSLEDDVIDLSHQVQKLQKQVSVLAENQANSEDKSARLKQENAALFARSSMLEEQIRELEIKSEERIREEQRRHKEALTRCDREKGQVIESYLVRIQGLEKERQELKEEVNKLRTQLDKTKQEKYVHQEKISELEFSLVGLNDEHKKLQELYKKEREEYMQERKTHSQLLEEMGKELEELRTYKIENEPFNRCRSPSFLEMPQRYRDLDVELRKIREENKALVEKNDDLQAQLLNSNIQEGQRLLRPPSSTSLAAEFDMMSKKELMQKFNEAQDDNQKLRDYVDKMLLNILEKSPQLLEVKYSGF